MITTEITSNELKVSRDQFWQASWVWTSKPHVVNKRLFGPKTCAVFRCLDKVALNEALEKLGSICDIAYTTSVQYYSDLISSKIPVTTCTESEAKTFSDGCYLLVRRLLFKKSTYFNPLEIVFMNYASDQALYYQVTTKCEKVHPSVRSFILQFKDKKIIIGILEESRITSHEWIQFLLLPKLIKWATESESIDFYIENNTASLSLIATDYYNELYLLWKEKYGKELVRKWTENTDPRKFVYEDIAIAAYLCLLWGKDKVNFVDLGCGNGLLVYILTQEGHRGRGIDIRSRKIWSSYPNSTILQIGTITPNENCLHADADWLIGNHSDELTPWIPIFAARSSSLCKFFLLPCCAYELSGQKFQRRNSSCSIYNDYIEYVKEICEKLNFYIRIDRLRIPSTKRICIVGSQRVVITEDHIKTILSEYQSEKFIPREAVERVRNCTKVDRSITYKICDTISKALIERQLAKAQTSDEAWSTNYSLSFEDAVKLLDPNDLKKLKNECGGLQTLLKNNHSIFIVQTGRIFFRKPSENRKRNEKWKLKPCWFFNNHPMKCPIVEDECSFAH